MLLGARQTIFSSNAGIPYISPDGNSYWDSEFFPTPGCEYVFSCLWHKFPRSNSSEYVLMGSHIYSGCVACTFNYGALNMDSLTIQADYCECRLTNNISNFLNKPSILRCKHLINDNYLSIGFDGGDRASVECYNIPSDSSMIICFNQQGHQYDGGGGIMPAGVVYIFGIDIIKNGTIVKSFLPAKINNRPCFYEQVSNNYIYSIGSTDGIFGIYNGK